MFYTQDSENRNVYRLAETGEKWSFRQLPQPVIVHSKLLGRFKKAVPMVAVGILGERGNYRLLVQVSVEISGSMGEGEWYADKAWDTVDVTGTQEGFRFKKHVLKLFDLFKWLAREQHRAAARQQRADQIVEARGHREGACPVCYGDFIVHKNVMVLHGYQRPGWGYVVGDCFGVGYAPLEVSPNGLIRYVDHLKLVQINIERTLADLPKLTHLEVQEGYDRKTKLPTLKKYTPGEVGWDRVFAAHKRRIELDLENIKFDIQERQKTIAAWQPKKWPRMEAPPEGKKVRGSVLHKRASYKNRGQFNVPLCRQFAMKPPKSFMPLAEKDEDVNCVRCRTLMP